MRDESSPNPTQTKVPGELLGFTENGRLSRCTSCTQWLRSCLGRPVSTFSTFTKDLAAGGEAALAEYVANLTRFKQLWKSAPGAYLTNVKGKLPLPSFVNQIEEGGAEDRTNFGVFWSKKVWDHNEEIPFPEDRAVIYKLDGQKLLRVWRDKKHGQPPGSITKSGVISKKA